MARPQKCRNIFIPPRMKGFRPFGLQSCNHSPVRLKYEEYESLRLINYEMLSHEEAAKKMNISRPTFTRIYNQMLKQIARSFVEGKSIEISGGNYSMEKEWYRCKKCFKLIEGMQNHFRCGNCSSFNKNELIKLN